jgi:hypothetical protein
VVTPTGTVHMVLEYWQSQVRVRGSTRIASTERENNDGGLLDSSHRLLGPSPESRWMQRDGLCMCACVRGRVRPDDGSNRHGAEWGEEDDRIGRPMPRPAPGGEASIGWLVR